MTRTSMAQLDGLAEMIDNALGLECGTHRIDRAYGRPRLVRSGGSVDVSPRLAAGELASWMRAYHVGIIAGVQAGWVRRGSAR